jgi:hypothetical protein
MALPPEIDQKIRKRFQQILAQAETLAKTHSDTLDSIGNKKTSERRQDPR